MVIKVGFGLGLTSSILGELTPIFYVILATMQEYFYSSWLMIFATLNIITSIFSIILVGVIFGRSRKLKTVMEVRTTPPTEMQLVPMEPKPITMVSSTYVEPIPKPITFDMRPAPSRVEIRYSVPEKCPHCKALLTNATVTWIGPLEAKCPFCEGLVKAIKEEI